MLFGNGGMGMIGTASNFHASSIGGSIHLVARSWQKTGDNWAGGMGFVIRKEEVEEVIEKLKRVKVDLEMQQMCEEMKA